jgi:hypothetical protein
MKKIIPFLILLVTFAAYGYQLATPTVTQLATSPATVIYNGTAQALTVTAALGVVGLGAITVKYDNSTTAPTNIGTYTITVSIAEGTGYAATTEDLSLGIYTIVKKTLTISKTFDFDREYNGNCVAVNTGSLSLVGIVTADVGNVLLDGSSVSFSFNNKIAVKGKPVTRTGDYELFGTKSANYSLTQPAENLSGNISPLTLTHNVTVRPTKVYNGTNAADYTGGLTNVISGDDAFLNAVLYYYNGANVQPNGAIAASTWSIGGADKYNYSNYSLPIFVTQYAAITQAAGIFATSPALNVTYSAGLTLADIRVPAHYVWETPATTVNAGNEQHFAAIYTDPSGNYSSRKYYGKRGKSNGYSSPRTDFGGQNGDKRHIECHP